MRSKARVVIPLALSAAIVGGLLMRAQAQSPTPHVMLAPSDLRWTDAPASLPRGAQVAVVEGDPSAAGPFTMRFKFPANYRIPPHSHPAIEHVTVLSGTLHFGMGDRLDPAQGRPMPVGSFIVMPIGTNHYAWTNEETVIQLHGIGPWGITYVNAADDPRRSN